MADLLTPFDRRVHLAPEEWKGPLVDVMDSFESVCLYLKDADCSFPVTPELALGLTKLVLNQKTKNNA